MFSISDIDTIKKLFEAGQKSCGEHFLHTDVFIHMRDTFYGDLKYGNRTPEEIMSKTCEPPKLDGDKEYAYASAYAAWICGKYSIEVPAWCRDERSFSFTDFVLCPYVADDDIVAVLSNPVKEFAARGWYVRERDLEIV